MNSQQRKEFNEVYTWAKDCIKHNGHNVEPINIFLPGSVGTSKTHLVKVIYHTISKTWLYHCEVQQFSGPTGISAVNRGKKPFTLALELNLDQSYLV